METSNENLKACVDSLPNYYHTSKGYLDEGYLSDEYIETRRPTSVDKEIKRHFWHIVKLWIKNIFTGKETS